MIAESPVLLIGGSGKTGGRVDALLKAQASGIAWTIVRASWFNQNFSEGPFLDGLVAGELALPAGPIPEPFVDAGDIAEVVVAALTDKRHANRLYEVTGPPRAHVCRGRGRDREEPWRRPGL